MDILCVLHDSDEYGVVRWPLADLARSAGTSLKLARELAEKRVLKGGDSGDVRYDYRPRHAGKEGDPVTLVDGCGPCWFSSRMVRDEWVRQQRGRGTRFSDENQPANKSGPKAIPDTTPSRTPKPPIGGESGYGPSSSSSSSVSTVEDKSSTAAGAAGGVSDPPAWWPTRDRYGRVEGEITDKIAFDLGRIVLGRAAGGQVQRMRAAYSGDWRAVVDFLLQAHEKSDPREWFAGVLKRAERDQHLEPKHAIYPVETHH